jgi:hypothetical protein
MLDRLPNLPEDVLRVQGDGEVPRPDRGRRLVQRSPAPEALTPRFDSSKVGHIASPRMREAHAGHEGNDHAPSSPGALRVAPDASSFSRIHAHEP